MSEQSVCDHCSKPSPSFRCKCQSARYCDANCQRAHYKEHRANCTSAKRSNNDSADSKHKPTASSSKQRVHRTESGQQVITFPLVGFKPDTSSPLNFVKSLGDFERAHADAAAKSLPYWVFGMNLVPINWQYVEVEAKR